ncbi:MAG: ABC transporter ATP-binding protein [Armatimonadetes bacterium]|nr:ABC transporter ATP-binding protein [Armatimonadota bacterium]
MVAIGLYGITKTFRSYNCGSRWLRRELIERLQRQRRQNDRWTVLREINLEIESGETVAILGRNGSGKSTLLKLMAGIIQPDAGTVVRHGSICTLLDIGTGFHEDLTGRENVFVDGTILGLSEKYLQSVLADIETFAELAGFMDTPLRYYSSGMRARLGFAIAMSANPDIFLIDEVLAVGDEGFRQKCYLRLDEFIAAGKTIIIVSHDLAAVQRLCKRGVCLHNGMIVADGPIDVVCKEYTRLFDPLALSVGGTS